MLKNTTHCYSHSLQQSSHSERAKMSDPLTLDDDSAQDLEEFERNTLERNKCLVKTVINWAQDEQSALYHNLLEYNASFNNCYDNQSTLGSSCPHFETVNEDKAIDDDKEEDQNEEEDRNEEEDQNEDQDEDEEEEQVAEEIEAEETDPEDRLRSIISDALGDSLRQWNKDQLFWREFAFSAMHAHSRLHDYEMEELVDNIIAELPKLRPI